MQNFIDDVARGLTTGDPSPAFRARVLHRLPDGRGQRGGWPIVPRPAVAIIALAGLAGGFAIAHRATGARWLTPAELPAAASPAALPRPAAAVAHDATPSMAAAVPRAERRGPAAVVDGAPAASPEEAAWLARAIPALGGPELIALDAIQPAGVVLPLLVIEPLAPARLELAPIGGRPGDTARRERDSARQ